jgi:hypothetical protein
MIINNKFQIDASQILFFARSIDDNNPLYVDVEYAKKKGYKNIIAPLTFIETHQQFDPNYKLRPNPDKQWPGTPRKKAEALDYMQSSIMNTTHLFMLVILLGGKKEKINLGNAKEKKVVN